MSRESQNASNLKVSRAGETMHAERTENLAFNTRLYVSYNNAEQRLASDLAALALETTRAPENRITPFTFVQTGKGRIECPEFANRDILETLRWKTASDILESKATLTIRDFILSQKEIPFIIIWISPPDKKLGYSEGRMVVGIGREKDELKIVENYGICIDFSSETCLLLGEQLLQFSENKKYSRIDSVDQLRATPIFMNPPKGIEPLDFIAQFIPFPDVWEKIKSGEARALKEQALKDARAIAQRIMPKVIRGANQWDYIVAGAQAEQWMAKVGWVMRANSGCGFLNTELLSSIVSVFSHSHLHLNNQGELVLKKSEAGVFVKKCPFCGRDINKVIQPGYKCACGQTYSGVC